MSWTAPPPPPPQDPRFKLIELKTDPWVARQIWGHVQEMQRLSREEQEVRLGQDRADHVALHQTPEFHNHLLHRSSIQRDLHYPKMLGSYLSSWPDLPYELRPRKYPDQETQLWYDQIRPRSWFWLPFRHRRLGLYSWYKMLEQVEMADGHPRPLTFYRHQERMRLTLTLIQCLGMVSWLDASARCRVALPMDAWCVAKGLRRRAGLTLAGFLCRQNIFRTIVHEWCASGGWSRAKAR